MKNRIRLGVNIDHIATLRKVRGRTTSYPDLISLMNQITRAGADQITLHLREDRRHINDEDLIAVCEHCLVDVNMEMAVTSEMVKIASKNKPDWVCLVPEKREELTTEGGLNVETRENEIGKCIEKLQSKGIEISLFLEPNLKHIKLASRLGADAVEFHTGKWVHLHNKKTKNTEWKRLHEAFELCHQLGMRVHAGHGLDYEHTERIKSLPHLKEVNIGHSIICYSLSEGLTHVVKKMKKILR